MGGHARSAIEDFHAAGRGAHLDLLMYERLGHAVEVILDGDVIVDVHARLAVASELVAADRQRLESRTIELLVGGEARARQAFERSGIQIQQQIRDGAIHIGKGCEHAVTQPRQDPALYDLHRHFDLRLVLWPVRARRQD